MNALIGACVFTGRMVMKLDQIQPGRTPEGKKKCWTENVEPAQQKMFLRDLFCDVLDYYNHNFSFSVSPLHSFNLKNIKIYQI